MRYFAATLAASAFFCAGHAYAAQGVCGTNYNGSPVHYDTYGNPCVGVYGSVSGSDPNNASFGGSGTAPITATVGTSYTVGRSLQTNCTTGGTITFTEASAAVPWIVGVGTTEIPHATTQVSSSGSASCTFIVHY
jgi:hypothetical protein